MNLPRLMLAAPKSGSGKTMLTCVLLELLKRQNKNVFSVKAGPDYIDPLFHETVQGVRCFNLDTFFADYEMTRRLLCEDLIDIAISDGANGDSKENDAKGFCCLMEGVMGLYDGIGGVEMCGSSYELAQWSVTPIVLVVDAKGAGRSLLATISGMLEMDVDGLIRGVVLNRISEGFYPRMRELIEAELHIPVLGFLPEREELAIESRYLGLVLPDEIANLKQRIRKAAEIAENTIDIEEIYRIMESAEEISDDNKDDSDGWLSKCYKTESNSPKENSVDNENDTDTENETRVLSKSSSYKDFIASVSLSNMQKPLNLAIAQDEAFCFYYRENLRMFEQAGFRLVPFSPIREEELPENMHALLLGGGYPELYAAELSQNHTMRESIKAAIQSGMPTIAECGGFLYLHERLSDKDGTEYPMCGIIRAGAAYRKRSVRFGYIIIEESRSENSLAEEKDTIFEEDKKSKTIFLSEGLSVHGHEFHHYESEDCGSDLIATRPYDGSSYQTGHLAAGQYFGFPHLYLPSAPAFVQSFRREVERYANGK